MIGGPKSTSRAIDPQLSFDFQTPCWLVIHDRVKNFHYVVEAELQGRTATGKAVVHTHRGEIITLPAEKVYATKEVAVHRQLECDRQVSRWVNC